MMIKAHYFAEAACLLAALESGRVAYSVEVIRNAADVAEQFGFPDVASWILHRSAL